MLNTVKFYVVFLLFMLIPFFSLHAQSSYGADWQNQNINLATDLSSSDRGINSSLIDAIKTIPRHMFTDESYYDIAYEDISLPGADKGFIASPSDILSALGMLSPASNDKILIAGNNTGYTAAILSKLSADIYLIEETSAAGSYPGLFSELAVDNINIADSADINWFNEIIAFDKIFICGAVSEISEKLTEKLAIQGNITFVMSEEGGFQQIISMRRSLLGDSIACGGSCFFPEIKVLKITN